MTRRSFIRRAAAAGAAIAAAGASALELFAPERRAGRRLWRGVALGPDLVDPAQRYGPNRQRFAETGTAWVRLWADWPRLQPRSDRPPALAALDADVEQAKTDGRRVMITAWRFPRWANGTASGADYPKDPTFRFPEDLGPGSDWGHWIDLLLTRYGDAIDALEIVNEPNLQFWPQRSPSGELVVDRAVATMIETAKVLAERRERTPVIVAPATSDIAGDTRTRTGYDTFTRALLDRLAERGFEPGPRVAWSHHNYTDVENGLSGADNRLARVREMLAGRFAGWPAGDASEPGIFVTESGARVDKVGRAKQAELLEASWQRMQHGLEGRGVAMVCQYLFVTDANYDSGLCDPDGAPRPAYHTWSQLPALSV